MIRNEYNQAKTMYYTINIWIFLTCFSHVFFLFDYSNFDIGIFAKKMFGKINKWWTQISSVGVGKFFLKNGKRGRGMRLFGIQE